MSLTSFQSIARRITIAASSVALLAACSTEQSTAPNIPSNPSVESYASSTGVVMAQMTKVNDNLFIRDVQVGSGALAASRDQLVVTYKGMLVNGQTFDSGSGFSFSLGAGQVIPGWDLGVAGMRVGGTRKLVIGSSLAYQNQRAGSIPPNSTLVFDVTLDRIVGK